MSSPDSQVFTFLKMGAHMRYWFYKNFSFILQILVTNMRIKVQPEFPAVQTATPQSGQHSASSGTAHSSAPTTCVQERGVATLLASATHPSNTGPPPTGPDWAPDSK